MEVEYVLVWIVNMQCILHQVDSGVLFIIVYWRNFLFLTQTITNEMAEHLGYFFLKWEVGVCK